MIEPIPGKWILFYDEETLILKEEFIVNPDVKLTEEQKKRIPKNRVYKCSCWNDFCRCKCGLKYCLENQEPVNMYRI